MVHNISRRKKKMEYVDSSSSSSDISDYEVRSLILICSLILRFSFLPSQVYPRPTHQLVNVRKKTSKYFLDLPKYHTFKLWILHKMKLSLKGRWKWTRGSSGERSRGPRGAGGEKKYQDKYSEYQVEIKTSGYIFRISGGGGYGGWGQHWRTSWWPRTSTSGRQDWFKRVSESNIQPIPNVRYHGGRKGWRKLVLPVLDLVGDLVEDAQPDRLEELHDWTEKANSGRCLVLLEFEKGNGRKSGWWFLIIMWQYDQFWSWQSWWH